ncbi:MAG: ACP S-malonyltransferase [Candidatus Portiera sp.]|nr:ACP S-malonyltransferase [Portiera sp.]
MSVAFVFPGQGSQHIGMLSPFFDEKPVKECFAEASELLNMDLQELCQQGPEDTMNATINTQPLLLTAGVALWRLWQSRGGAIPALMAGHSLGEYTALVCGGYLDFATTLDLVRNRGRYMQLAMGNEKGSMAAILGLGLEEVNKICEDASTTSYVYPANINSPKQIVISGYYKGVEQAAELAKAAGAKRTILLPVSIPSHCALMQPAAAQLADNLQAITFNKPEVQVVHNLDAQLATTSDEIKEKLLLQLTKSVQWVSSIEFMVSKGITTIVECGPKKVLSSLNRSIASNLQLFPLGEDPEKFKECLEALS